MKIEKEKHTKRERHTEKKRARESERERNFKWVKGERYQNKEATREAKN